MGAVHCANQAVRVLYWVGRPFGLRSHQQIAAAKFTTENVTDKKYAIQHSTQFFTKSFSSFLDCRRALINNSLSNNETQFIPHCFVTNIIVTDKIQCAVDQTLIANSSQNGKSIWTLHYRASWIDCHTICAIMAGHVESWFSAQKCALFLW